MFIFLLGWYIANQRQYIEISSVIPAWRNLRMILNRCKAVRDIYEKLHSQKAADSAAVLWEWSQNQKVNEQLAKQIAMQIAAMNPIAIDEDGVSEEVKQKEIEVAIELSLIHI